MDKESIKKQVQDELQSQFASKLKEARQGKLRAEEELETAAERWRSERRRMNLDIDRLESELVRAKEKSRKPGRADSKTNGVDAVEVAKIRASADERMAKAMKDWEAERARLVSQTERLEKAVAEAIERSSNPLRATQAVKEQFELKAGEISRAREKVEDDFRKAQLEWTAEKLKLTAEFVKTRRSSTSEVQTRLTSLQTQLKDATGVREQQQTQIKQLEQSLSEVQGQVTEKKVAQLKRDFEDQIQILSLDKSQLSKELQSATETFKVERERLMSELSALQKRSEAEGARFEADLTKASRAAESTQSELGQTTRANKEITNDLEAVHALFEKERQRFSAHIAGAAAAKSQDGTDYDERVTALESQLAEATGAKEKVTKELKAVRTVFEEERERFAFEIARGAKSVEPEQVNNQWAQERTDLHTQIQQLERTLSETKDGISNDIVGHLREQYDSTIDEMIRQKTQLSKELQTASSMFEAERARFVAGIGNVGKSDEAANRSDDAAIALELARVESLVRELGTMIDNPSTDLSTVIRKNVEKAELDAYLKGILFSMGRGKGMASLKEE